ncbi:hypothetical protein HPT30_13730 [Paenibacillus sp. JW14]|uniref:Uncharacterized protein n=2 Tax=Paenibacillus agri TaxID=2744309 RepID=A0A850EPD2_9BACL|nr:hypothetical protein [Paenibacillus agri]
MMIGNILINLLSGVVGFMLTFLVTYGNNLLMTSLIRGLFGFITWFLLAFLLRWVLGVMMKQTEPQELTDPAAGDGEEALGARLNISTPDEDEELKNLLKPKPAEGNGDNGGFTPLNPPKLVTMKDPEELAKAVRHLKEE